MASIHAEQVKPLVMLVTSEKATVIVLRALLERMGFVVQVARNCQDARRALHAGIRWIVLDAEVGGDGHLDLMTYARDQQLPAEFILVTGNDGLRRLRSEQWPRPLALLRKPLEFSALLDLIAEDTAGAAAA